MDQASTANFPKAGDLEACKAETLAWLDCLSKLDFADAVCDLTNKGCATPAATQETCLSQHPK